MNNEYTIFPLGDSAITIDLGNHIDEKLNDKVLAMNEWLIAHRFEGFTDTIAAYSSLSVFYDPVKVRSYYPASSGAFAFVKQVLRDAWTQSFALPAAVREPVRIPVCYEPAFGPDLGFVALQKGLDADETIRLHCQPVYRVYMIGFLPGFAYLGEIDKKLETARKSRPTAVVAGSVGITGRQTGIYPLNSPGGWQIIGRTPLRLFDAAASNPVLLKTGDHVSFYPVSPEEFGRIAVL